MSRLQGSARADSLRPVLGAVVLLFVTLLGAAGLKSYRDLTAARGREKLLETRIEESHTSILHLRGRIDRLRADPAMLERLAREDLGLVRPSDVVIELPRDPVAPAALGAAGPAAVGAATTAAVAGAAAAPPAPVTAPPTPVAASPPVSLSSPAVPHATSSSPAAVPAGHGAPSASSSKAQQPASPPSPRPAVAPPV